MAPVQSDQPAMPTPDEMPRVAAVQSDQLTMRTPDEILHIRNGLLHEFADIFADSPLCPMPGPPMDTELEANAKPTHVAGARVLPYAYRDQVQQQLEDMVTGGGGGGAYQNQSPNHLTGATRPSPCGKREPMKCISP